MALGDIPKELSINIKKKTSGLSSRNTPLYKGQEDKKETLD